MASLKDLIFGKKGKFKQVPTMTSEQQELLKQLLGGIGGSLGPAFENLQSLLSGEAGAYEAPAMRQFEEQIVPGIAERFTGMGAGSQSSSAFGQQLGSAGAGLAENLAMQRAGLQQQGLSQLSQLLGMGMGARPFESTYTPGSSGLMGAVAPGLGMAAGSVLPGMFSGGFSGIQSLLSKLIPGTMYSPGSGIRLGG